jgi:hypothetical protein
MWTDSHVDAIARLELKDRARIASPLSECPRLTIAFARCGCATSEPKVCFALKVSFVPHADAFGENDQGTVGFKKHINQDQRLITRMNH